MPEVVVGGTTIGYHDTGAPAGVPGAQTVVFAHGLLFDSTMFEAQVEVLRGRYRCVAFDWRGQGTSPPTVDGYDIETLTRDALGLLRALDIGPVHWVGLSMGGFVGLRLGARHGEMLLSLTLLDTSARAETPGTVREYKRLAWTQQLIGFGPIASMVAPHMFGPSYRRDPRNKASLDRWRQAVGQRKRSSVRKAVYGVAERASVDHEIGAIAVPTLVLVGADDAATPPSESEHIASSIPTARLQVIDNCGHSSTVEQPAAISAHLADFLAEVSRTQ